MCASKYGASAKWTTECIISKGEIDAPPCPALLFSDAEPGRLRICICEEKGIVGSKGRALLKSAIDAAVEGEEESSAARV